MKNLDKKNCHTKNETYTPADEQEYNTAQPVIPRPVGVARPVQFPHRENAIPKVSTLTSSEDPDEIPMMQHIYSGSTLFTTTKIIIF